jgi:hypothetical protein
MITFLIVSGTLLAGAAIVALSIWLDLPPQYVGRDPQTFWRILAIMNQHKSFSGIAGNTAGTPAQEK